MMFTVVKSNKRLWIKNEESGELVYTTPDFIYLIDRNLMHQLAYQFNQRGKYDIEDVIIFETKARRHKKFSQRKSPEKEWIFK